MIHFSGIREIRYCYCCDVIFSFLSFCLGTLMNVQPPFVFPDKCLNVNFCCVSPVFFHLPAHRPFFSVTHCRYSPKNPSLVSETVHYKRGVSQQFSMPSFKIDFSEWKEEDVSICSSELSFCDWIMNL